MAVFSRRSAAAVMGKGLESTLCLSHISPEGVSAENTVVL